MSVIITTVLIIFASIVIGVVLGNGAVYVFNRIPGNWLCDYDEEPSEELKNPTRQRIHSVPYKAIFTAFFICASFKILTFSFSSSLSLIIALWLLLEIAIADKKYMIIPTQFLSLLIITTIGLIPYYVNSYNYMLKNQGEDLKEFVDPILTILGKYFPNILVGPAFQILGFLTGFLIMLFIYLLGKVIYRQEGLGFGDIKLCGVIGLIIGPVGIMITIICSMILSAMILVILLFRKKVNLKDKYPLGHYICAMTAIYILVFIV